MDPHAVLRPVGPEPPTVYWRRRAVVLGLVLVVVVAVVWVLTGSGGTSPTDGHSASRSTGPTSGASSPSSSGGDLCRRPDLRVAATTDATTYPAGSTPRLSASLTNLGTTTCRFNASASARVWRILSGPDVVWSSAACTHTRTRVFATIQRGATIRWSLAWDGHRSTSGCASSGSAAQPGTYRLYVTIDRVTSAAAVFHLA